MCASLQLSQPDPRILHQPSYWFQGWWQSHSWTSLASIFLNFPAAARSQLEATMSWVMGDGLRLSASCWESWKTKRKKGEEGEGRVGKKRKFFQIWWILFSATMLTSCPPTNETDRQILRDVYQNREVCGQAFLFIIPFLSFFALVTTFSSNSHGNTCYTGYMFMTSCYTSY